MIIKRLWGALKVGFSLLHQVFHIMYGFYKISKLSQPTISIFGGSRMKLDSRYTNQAYDLAARLAQAGVSVLTGGGPGIMEAANCGAIEARGKYKGSHAVTTMGIGITHLKYEKGLNVCAAEQVMVDYFFARKWLLTHYSLAFVFFPGGIGTMDELSDLLNLMQTGKLAQAPVILIGTEFWKFYFEWLALARHEGLLFPREQPEVMLTDDIDQVFGRIIAHCKAAGFDPS